MLLTFTSYGFLPPGVTGWGPLLLPMGFVIPAFAKWYRSGEEQEEFRLYLPPSYPLIAFWQRIK
jgi:hypothetical protein